MPIYGITSSLHYGLWLLFCIILLMFVLQIEYQLSVLSKYISAYEANALLSSHLCKYFVFFL